MQVSVDNILERGDFVKFAFELFSEGFLLSEPLGNVALFVGGLLKL